MAATGQRQLLWRMWMSWFMLTLIVCAVQKGTAQTPEPIVGSKSALGKLVNLPKTDILDNLNSGYLLFTTLPESTTEAYSRGGSNTQYFASSEQFRRQLSADAGLDATVASVSVSLQASFNAISGFETNVSVAKAFAESLVSVTYITSDHLNNLTLRPDFLSSFQSLPVTIQNEWQASAWLEVAEFLETWGTHVTVAAYTGATFEAYSSAASSRQYSQQDLEARACLKAEGFTNSVQGCAGFSDAQKKEAAGLNTNDRRFAKGASAATRNRLLTQAVTPSAIEAFLNEAAVDEQPVRYRFLPLWSLLRRRFEARSDDWRRATNLGAYYDGWLGFGCKQLMMKENDNVVTAQWFRFDVLSDTGYAKCLRRCLGCHSYYQDCFSYNSQCVCAGPSCLVPDNTKPGYHIRVQDDDNAAWVGLGCDFENHGCFCGETNSEVGCDFQIDNNKYAKYTVLWDQTPTTLDADVDDLDIPLLAKADATVAIA